MTKLSISTAWDETKAVVAHDGRLLFTVALGLVGVPALVSALVTPPLPNAELPAFGGWAWIAFLALIVRQVGLLSICRLAMGSGVRVGDAISGGVKRVAIYVAAVLIILVPLSLVSGLLSQMLPAKGPEQARQMAIGMAVLLALLLGPWLSRFLVAPAVGVAESGGPFALLARCWRLARGHGLRLFGLALLTLVAYVILALALSQVFGTIAILLFGPMQVGSISHMILALVSALFDTVLYVFLGVMLARIYLQLVAPGPAEVSVPSSGT